MEVETKGSDAVSLGESVAATLCLHTWDMGGHRALLGHINFHFPHKYLVLIE